MTRHSDIELEEGVGVIGIALGLGGYLREHIMFLREDIKLTEDYEKFSDEFL
ncbi:MAG: hypothetical protein ACC609_07850 [Methanobacterium formicicum]